MWGNGIIGAVKMEEMGIPGRVHISDATARLIGEEFSLSVAHEEMEPSFVASYAIAKSFVVEQRPSVSMNDDDLKQLTAKAAVEKALERSEEAASGHTRRRNQADKDSAGGGGKLKRTGTGTLSMIKRKLSSTSECPARRSSSVSRSTTASSVRRLTASRALLAICSRLAYHSACMPIHIRSQALLHTVAGLFCIRLQVGSVLAAAGRFSGDVHNIRRSSFDREGGVLSLEFKDGARRSSRHASGLPIGNFLRSVQSGAQKVVRNATRSHSDSRGKDGTTAGGGKPEAAAEAEAEAAAVASASASATASLDSMQARINSIRGTTVRRIKHVQGFLREKGTAAPGAAGQAGGNQRTGSLTRTGSMNFFKQVWLTAYLGLLTRASSLPWPRNHGSHLGPYRGAHTMAHTCHHSAS